MCAPNANDDHLDGLKIGATATINVLTNDRDAQGDIDPTTVQLLDGSGNKVKTLEVSGEGTWKVANDGTVTFSPAAGFTGSPTPVKYTVSDKAGHESQPAIITLTYESAAADPAKPVLEKGTGTEQGGVTVTPGANTDKVDITYTDENDKPQTITVSKGPAGQWLATGVPENQGITVDAATGAVKLPPDAVKIGRAHV